MCRILVANSTKPLDVAEHLEHFADASEASERWQGDGWGITIRSKSGWQTHHSTKSIWEDRSEFAQFDKATYFLVHARGSSFGKHRDNVDYNQPFTNGDTAFVFNGFVNGVKLPFDVPGSIGSQKIFSLAQKYLNRGIEGALQETKDLLMKHSNLVEALNVALVDDKTIGILSRHTTKGDYHTLWLSESKDTRVISSEQLPDYEWSALQENTITIYPVMS